MFRAMAADLRAVKPGFAFSAYPDFTVEDVRTDWRLQAMAVGLNSPDAPFIVVNSTPYWENPTRPWWDSAAEAYRRMGIRHVMGSWDAGIMGTHNESHVGAAELMYELAMASDGFWRWGERQYDTDDWRSFAMVNQRLRRVESRLGDFLFGGDAAPHFVTLVEQTGNPLLERALVSRTWEREGRYLVRIFNGNTDWPIHVRAKFPRVGQPGPWRVRDPVHDVDYVPAAGGTWSLAGLRDGLIVPIQGRAELFLLLERAPQGFEAESARSVRSFDVPAHRPRPDAAEPLPDADASAGDRAVVFTRSAPGGYMGEQAGQALSTVIHLTDPDSGKDSNLLGLQGFARQPRFSSDRRHVVCTVYVNGKGQIYVVNAVGGQARNISRNDHCDRSPRFSPDGRSVVFESDRDGDWEIYSMAADGSRQTRLTDSPGVDRSPAVSANGDRVAFLSNRAGDLDVHVMRIDGSKPRRLTARSGNEYDPIWSPDGRLIACTVQRRHQRCIQIAEADGGSAYFIAHGPATDLRDIRFSPDGTTIAGAFSNYGRSDVLTTRVDAKIERDPDWKGEGIKKLVDLDSMKPYHNLWYSTGTGSPRMVTRTFGGVSFSPDGREVLYCSDQGGNGVFSLYTIPVGGGEPKAVAGATSVWPMTTDWSAR